MAEMEFIKLMRKFTEWEWYTDSDTKALFIHCIIRANWKPGKWCGIVCERGQFITSLAKLSAETGLSIRKVRTALKHLEATGEVTNKTTQKFRVITINNYDLYQQTDKQNDKQNDKLPTNYRQTTDNNRRIKKNKQEEKEEREGTPRTTIPPSLEEVIAYCRERGNTISPEHFIDYYAARGWKLGSGQKMKDWKAAIRTWERKEREQSEQQPEQRQTGNKFKNFQQRDTSSDEYKAMVAHITGRGE